jgi:hypothetical protein
MSCSSERHADCICGWADRALFIWLYRRRPRILDAITIVRPKTVLRWHRMGFAAYWRWKSLEPRHNFPSIKNEEIPSKHSCKLVRTAEKLGYRRGVPARASRVPNAAFVKRPHDRFERGCASSSDCFGDRQKTGRELVGGGDLDLPAAHSRRSDV